MCVSLGPHCGIAEIEIRFACTECRENRCIRCLTTLEQLQTGHNGLKRSFQSGRVRRERTQIRAICSYGWQHAHLKCEPSRRYLLGENRLERDRILKDELNQR